MTASVDGKNAGTSASGCVGAGATGIPINAASANLGGPMSVGVPLAPTLDQVGQKPVSNPCPFASNLFCVLWVKTILRECTFFYCRFCWID